MRRQRNKRSHQVQYARVEPLSSRVQDEAQTYNSKSKRELTRAIFTKFNINELPMNVPIISQTPVNLCN